MLKDAFELNVERGQRVMAGEVLLPRLILKQSALEYNIQRMAQYCRERGVSLAPHAKTTMSPGILKRQADAGVWGFTAATVVQAQKLRRLGVERILIANEVVEPLAISWIATELSKDAGFEALVLVDSVRGVRILDSALQLHRPPCRLGVLIEVAEQGARAGCRTDEEAINVADAVRASAQLRLAGVEGFEALVKAESLRPYVQRLRTLATQLAQRGYFANAAEVIVSVGTSEHIEVTAEELAGWKLDPPVRVLLRPGAYATNCIMPGYRPSLEICGAIVSRPEPNLAIASFGQRDVPTANVMPEPLTAFAGSRKRDIKGRTKVLRLYDQHAVIELDDMDLETGELVTCAVVSPYRPPFATWRTIPIVDDDYRVVEVLDVLY